MLSRWIFRRRREKSKVSTSKMSKQSKVSKLLGENCDKEAQDRLGVLLGVDAEFVHSSEERRSGNSQACGSTIATAHAPLARGKCPYDLVALFSFIFINNAASVTSGM